MKKAIALVLALFLLLTLAACGQTRPASSGTSSGGASSSGGKDTPSGGGQSENNNPSGTGTDTGKEDNNNQQNNGTQGSDSNNNAQNETPNGGGSGSGATTPGGDQPGGEQPGPGDQPGPAEPDEVQVILPAYMFANYDEEELAGAAAEMRATDWSILETGEGCFTMPRDVYEENLETLYNQLKSGLDEMAGPDGSLPSMTKLTYDEDFQHFEMVIDQTKETGAEALNAVMLCGNGAYYLAYAGKDVAPEDITARMVDAETGEEIATYTYQDYLDFIEALMNWGDDPAEAPELPTVEEQVLLDKDGVVITLLDYGYDSFFGRNLHFRVENNTDRDIEGRLQIDAINGMYISESGSVTLAPGETGEGEAYLWSDFDELGVREVGEFELTAMVIDPDTWEVLSSETGIIVPTSIAGEDDLMLEMDDELLYADENVEIYLREVVPGQWNDAPTVVLYFINHSGRELKIESESVTVDGVELNSWVYVKLPDSHCYVTQLYLNEDLLKWNEIRFPNTVDVIFGIYEPDEWEPEYETYELEIPVDLDLVFERGDMEDPNGGNSEPVQTDDWIEMPTVEETRFFQDEDLGLTMTLTDLYRDGDSGYIVLEMELENSSDRDLYLQPTRVTLNGLMCGGDMDTVVYAGETYTGVIVLYNQPEDMGIYKLTEAEMWYYVVDYDTDEYLTEELYALFATSDFGAEDAQMDYTMGVEIYNDNDILVYMIEELVDEDGDVLLSLYIENTGETDVIIYGNSFSAQGWELSDYFSPIVYAGSKQIYPMYIYQEEYQNYGLLCPFIAELDVEFWDENWEEIYPATIFQIPVDLELDIPQQVLPPEEVLSDGQTIYDENGLTIIVYEQYEDEDGDMDLLFYVKNDSDKNVEIMDNGFYLGENVLEDYFWLDLEAHSETTYIMYVYGDEIALAGGSTPFDVDLVLTFTDMDTAEELYPAETLTFSVTAEWTGAGYYEPQPTGAEVNEELLASGETIYNEHGITIVLYDQFVDEDGDVNLLFYLVNNSSYDISVESQVFRVGEYDLYDWLYTTVDAYQDDYFTLYIYGVEMEDAEVSFPFDVDLVLSFSDADEWESLYPDEALSFTVQPE